MNKGNKKILLLLFFLFMLINIKITRGQTCPATVNNYCYKFRAVCNLWIRYTCADWGCTDNGRTPYTASCTTDLSSLNCNTTVDPQEPCHFEQQFSQCIARDNGQYPILSDCNTIQCYPCFSFTEPSTCTDDTANYGQQVSCTNLGGICQNSCRTTCSNGTYQSGLCPGPSYWHCCVPSVTPTPILLPDLTIVEPRHSPTTITEGDNVNFFFKIRNKGTLGTGQLANFNVRLQIDYNSDGGASFNNDIYERKTGIGAGNTTNEIQGNFNLPWTAVYSTTGNHRYRICADLPDNKITEIIDSWQDNCSDWVNFTVQRLRSDLIIQSVTLDPENPEPKDTITLNVVIKNQGLASTYDGFTNKAQLNIDGDQDWDFEKEVNSNVLEQNGTTTVSFVMSSWQARSGTFKYKVCTDTTNIIDENNENNNCTAELNFSVPYPDLIVESVSYKPTNLKANDIATFSGVIKNIGEAKTGWPFYNTLTIDLNNNDYCDLLPRATKCVCPNELDYCSINIPEFKRQMSSLENDDGQNTRNVSFTGISEMSSQGTHAYRICTDSDNDIVEGTGRETTGNCKTGTYSIQYWYKLRDAAFAARSSINNPIPDSPPSLVPYDSDDPGNYYFINNLTGINDAGVVTAQDIYTGNAPVSRKAWKKENITYTPPQTVNEFKKYLMSKKSEYINVITDYTDNTDLKAKLLSNKINIVLKEVVIDDNSLLTGRYPIVLLIDGKLTINIAQPSKTLNPSNNSAIFMATGNIVFADDMKEANGVFISDGNVNLGANINQGIKIRGNIIAKSLTQKRKWLDPLKPGFFMIFDPSHYITTINMLSTMNYDWRQLQ